MEVNATQKWVLINSNTLKKTTLRKRKSHKQSPPND